MKKIFLLALSVFMAMSLVACGGSKEQTTSGSNKSAASKSNVSASKSDVSASKTDEAVAGIVGTWAYSDGGVVMESQAYTFNADMTGNYTIIGDFTYTDDGSKIVFTYKDSKVYTEPMTFAYRIEGDKLIFTDDLKAETVFVKQ